MTKPDLRSPNLVVLSSRIWADELAAELRRLGHPEDAAQRTARTVLARVLGRARWPEQSYLVDDRGMLEELTP